MEEDGMKNQDCPICGRVRVNEDNVVASNCEKCGFDFYDETEFVLTRIKRSWCPEWLFWLFEGFIKYPPFRQIFTKKV
jgi:ribosomal protein L37AE/L43A